MRVVVGMAECSEVVSKADELTPADGFPIVTVRNCISPGYPREDGMVRKKLGRGRKNRCRFCTKDGCPRPVFVDYKDVQGLKKLCTSQGKLFSRKRSGIRAAYQRAVSDAIKRARFMALLPYVGE